MSTLAPLLRDFRDGLPGRSKSGVAPTGVPGVTFFWVGEAVARAPLLYSAGLVIIGQGRKVGYLGDRKFHYDAETCLVLGVPVPFECETHATPEEPLLGIRIDIDLPDLHGLVARFGGRLGLERRDQGSTHSGVEPVAMEGGLLAATVRLLASLGDSVDRRIIGTGDSPVQYLKKIRLLKAKGLLVFEGKQVNEAAYEVGYASPSQFSREFKRYFQVPPSEAESLPYSFAG